MSDTRRTVGKGGGESKYAHACTNPKCGKPVGWQQNLCWDCAAAKRHKAK